MEKYLASAWMGISIAVICYRLGFKNGIDRGINMGKLMAYTKMINSTADKFDKDKKPDRSEIKEELNR